MKRFYYYIPVLSAIFTASQLCAETLVVDANTTKLAPYSLQKYDRIIFEESDKWLQIDVNQIEPGTTKNLPLAMDTLRITRNIAVISDGPTDKYPWPVEKNVNHIIIEGEATGLPVYCKGKPGYGFFEVISYERRAGFSKLFSTSHDVSLELRCKEFTEQAIDFCRWSSSVEDGFVGRFKKLIVGSECEVMSGSCFTSIDYIFMEGIDPPRLNSIFNTSIYEKSVLIVPDGFKSEYVWTQGWDNFKNIFTVSEFDELVRKHYEYEASLPERYWESLPEDKVWAPWKSFWSDYDYLYFPSPSVFKIDEIINFKVTNRNNKPEFKNTILYIDGGFIIYEDDRDSDYKKWFFPYGKMKDLKDIVFGRDMIRFPYKKTFISSLEPPTLYYEQMPFEIEPDSEYVVWFNCTDFYKTYTKKEHKWRNNVKELHIGPYVSKLPVSFPNVMDIFSAAETPPEASSEVFTEEQYEYAIVRVPEGTLDAYKAASGWKNFKHLTDVDPSGLERVVENPVEEMYIRDGILNVGYESVSAQDIEVYTVDGRMIYRGRDARIAVPEGVIIVRCGNKTRKLNN